MPRYGDSHSRPRYPETPEDLARALADPEAFAEMFPSERDPGGAWTDFTTSYIKANSHLRDLINDQISAGQYENFRDDALHGRVNALGERFRPGASADGGKRHGRFYNKHAPGVLTEGILPASEWPLSDFFNLISKIPERRGDTGRMEQRNRMAAAAAQVYGKGAAVRIKGAMSERVPSEGGFLVPENLRDDLLTLVLEHSVVRPRANIVPMDSLRVPWPSIDDISHETSVYGGVQAFWTEEGAALTASAPSFSRIVLEARKLTSFTSIPNELIQDAGPTVEQFIQQTWPMAIAWFEDLAYITGTGVGEPQGFLHAPASVLVPCTTTDNVLDWTAVVQMYSRFWPPSLESGGALWMCSPDTVPQLLQLAASATTDTSGTSQIAPPLLLSGMQGIGTPPKEILGIPLVVSEKMPSSLSGNSATAGALALVDFGMYLLGDRQSMQASQSDEYLFGQDQVAFRLIQRSAGMIWPQAAVQPFNGGPTLSPVVLWKSYATS